MDLCSDGPPMPALHKFYRELMSSTHGSPMSKIWVHKAIRGATSKLTWPAAGANRPKNRYTGDHPGPKPMNPALFGSGSDAFHQPQVAPGRGEAHRSRGGYVAPWAPGV